MKKFSVAGATALLALLARPVRTRLRNPRRLLRRRLRLPLRPPPRRRKSRTHASIAGIPRWTRSCPPTGRWKNSPTASAGPKAPSGSSPEVTCCSPTCPATRCGSGRRRAAWRNSSIPRARRARTRKSGAKPAPTAWQSSMRAASCSRIRAIAPSSASTSRPRPRRRWPRPLDGKKFSSPNDVVKMKSGVFFFTDPPYGFKKFDDAPQKEVAFNGVYRAGTDGKVTRHREGAVPPQRRRVVAR